jgi:hypothetical protein
MARARRYNGILGRAKHAKNKYGAVKEVVDNITFHSRKEAARYRELKLLLRAGEISDLELQPRFEFRIDGTLMFTYVSDFQYIDLDEQVIVEDAKGLRTSLYKLKKKIIEKAFGITITET